MKVRAMSKTPPDKTDTERIRRALTTIDIMASKLSSEDAARLRRERLYLEQIVLSDDDP